MPQGPFLVTDNLTEMKAGLTHSEIEGVIWKNAIPKQVLDAVTAFNFSRINLKLASCVQNGKDPERSVVMLTWLSSYFDELSMVDRHIKQVRSQFTPGKYTGPVLKSWNSNPCHFIAQQGAKLRTRTPHVDVIPSRRMYKGKLGEEWNATSTPDDYPMIKLVGALSRTSNNISTFLIPRSDAGDGKKHREYPHASRKNAIHAEDGDIICLKYCVTVHFAPDGIEQRWTTIY